MYDCIIIGSGPAYHNARDAINATEESLGYSVLLLSGGENDIIINSLLNSTAVIINKQSEYQNQVMLLSELLYPINSHGILDISELKYVVKLITQKTFVSRPSLYKLSNNYCQSLFNRMPNLNFESKPIEVTDNTDTFFVTEGKVRGLPIQLSEMVGVSRQSMDKTIKTANIYEARNLAVATLKILKCLEER